jgi:hypothetical protein
VAVLNAAEPVDPPTTVAGLRGHEAQLQREEAGEEHGSGPELRCDKAGPPVSHNSHSCGPHVRRHSPPFSAHSSSAPPVAGAIPGHAAMTEPVPTVTARQPLPHYSGPPFGATSTTLVPVSPLSVTPCPPIGCGRRCAGPPGHLTPTKRPGQGTE